MKKVRTSKEPRAMSNGGENGLCLVTLEGVVLTCNSALLALLGKNADEIVERRCHEVFSCPVPLESGCPLARTMESHRRATSRIQRGDRYLNEEANPLFDASGMMSAVLLSMSESPKAAVNVPDLVRLDRLVAIAQATSGVVHDFNNVLTRIHGAVHLLKEELAKRGDGSGSSAWIPLINDSIDQGKALTQQLLAFGKGHEPDKSVIVLTDVVRRAVSFALIGSSARPVVDVPEDLWPVKVNEGQMIQVISNLTINAIEAVRTGSPVWIDAENVPEKAAMDAGLEFGRYVRIRVRDEGPGIAPDQLDRLFEPFFTTKKNGTGLGLATANLIVRSHRGRIDVSSEVGRGTTFTIHLPAADENPTRHPEARGV